MAAEFKIQNSKFKVPGVGQLARAIRHVGRLNLPTICLYVLRLTFYSARVFPYVALPKDKSWQPGPYPGVELLVLHKHEATGGVTVLRKFHAGVTVPAHVHPLANEYAYVLSGEWEESGVVHMSGTFFFAPKGERHGPHVARTEVLSLTHFDGPLTVV
jgi:hypothetical protein